MSELTESQTSVSAYVADLCAELVGIAESAHLHMLAYLLDMARIEAEATVRSATPAVQRGDARPSKR